MARVPPEAAITGKRVPGAPPPARTDRSTPPKTDDFLFRSGDTEAKTWTVFLVKETPASYSYNATYFLLDNRR